MLIILTGASDFKFEKNDVAKIIGNVHIGMYIESIIELIFVNFGKFILTNVIYATHALQSDITIPQSAANLPIFPKFT